MYGKTVDRLLKQKSSVIVLPPQVVPHCLLIAMKAAVLAIQGKHKSFLHDTRKRQLYKLTSYAKKVREECGLPSTSELKVTDRFLPSSGNGFFTKERLFANLFHQQKCLRRTSLSRVDRKPFRLYMLGAHLHEKSPRSLLPELRLEKEAQMRG